MPWRSAWSSSDERRAADPRRRSAPSRERDAAPPSDSASRSAPLVVAAGGPGRGPGAVQPGADDAAAAGGAGGGRAARRGGRRRRAGALPRARHRSACRCSPAASPGWSTCSVPPAAICSRSRWRRGVDRRAGRADGRRRCSGCCWPAPLGMVVIHVGGRGAARAARRRSRRRVPRRLRALPHRRPAQGRSRRGPHPRRRSDGPRVPLTEPTPPGVRGRSSGRSAPSVAFYRARLPPQRARCSSAVRRGASPAAPAGRAGGRSRRRLFAAGAGRGARCSAFGARDLGRRLRALRPRRRRPPLAHVGSRWLEGFGCGSRARHAAGRGRHAAGRVRGRRAAGCRDGGSLAQYAGPGRSRPSWSSRRRRWRGADVPRRCRWCCRAGARPRAAAIVLLSVALRARPPQQSRTSPPLGLGNIALAGIFLVARLLQPGRHVDRVRGAPRLERDAGRAGRAGERPAVRHSATSTTARAVRSGSPAARSAPRAGCSRPLTLAATVGAGRPEWVRKEPT